MQTDWPFVFVDVVDPEWILYMAWFVTTQTLNNNSQPNH